MREALVHHGRVLLALMLREARTRYGRRRAGYLWALLEPILHIMMFAVVFSYAARAAPLGDSVIMFLATGLATYIGFRNVLNRTQGGYGSNAALLAFPVVKLMDVFVARAVLELATWIAVTFILIGSLIAFGYGPLPYSVLLMIAAVLSLAGIGFGVGTALGLLGEFVPSVGTLLSVPMRLLYFASGVFFLPDEVIPAIRDVIWWNPILHGITLFRLGYYKMYDSHMFSPLYLSGWLIGSLLLGFIAEKAARRPIRNLN